MVVFDARSTFHPPFSGSTPTTHRDLVGPHLKAKSDHTLVMAWRQWDIAGERLQVSLRCGNKQRLSNRRATVVDLQIIQHPNGGCAKV